LLIDDDVANQAGVGVHADAKHQATGLGFGDDGLQIDRVYRLCINPVVDGSWRYDPRDHVARDGTDIGIRDEITIAHRRRAKHRSWARRSEAMGCTKPAAGGATSTGGE
jgi:hypothetical protein